MQTKCVPLKYEPAPQHILPAQRGLVTSVPYEGAQQKHQPRALAHSFSDDMPAGEQAEAMSHGRVMDQAQGSVPLGGSEQKLFPTCGP